MNPADPGRVLWTVQLTRPRVREPDGRARSLSGTFEQYVGAAARLADECSPLRGPAGRWGKKKGRILLLRTSV